MNNTTLAAIIMFAVIVALFVIKYVERVVQYHEISKDYFQLNTTFIYL